VFEKHPHHLEYDPALGWGKPNEWRWFGAPRTNAL